MSVEQLLSHLENVKRTGAGRWIARCSAHDDKHPSLSVRELEDGRVLLHCFAQQCAVHDIVTAVGLDLSALFPEREMQHGKPERRPIPAADVLRCVLFEALVVATAAENLAEGKALAQPDLERLRLASARLQAARWTYHD